MQKSNFEQNQIANTASSFIKKSGGIEISPNCRMQFRNSRECSGTRAAFDLLITISLFAAVILFSYFEMRTNSIPLLLSLLLVLAVMPGCGRTAKGGGPLSMIYRKSMTLSSADLTRLERTQDSGTFVAASNSLVFHGQGPHIVISAGPRANMYSFRIQSHENPTLVFAKGALVTLTVANIDPDMEHDLLIGKAQFPMPPVPDTAAAFGTTLLSPEENGAMPANEFAFHASVPGTYSYLCSVPGHAVSGMYGAIVIATPSTMDSVLHGGMLAGTPARADTSRHPMPMMPGMGSGRMGGSMRGMMKKR